MAKLNMGSLKDFSGMQNRHKLYKQFNAHRNHINVATRGIQTVLQFASCKSPMEVANTLLNTVERITSAKDGNMFGMTHGDFIDVNNMTRFDLDLDDSYYVRIINALPQDHIGADYWNYMIYYIDGRPMTYSPDENVRKAGNEDRNTKYMMARPEDIGYIQNYLNSALRNSFSQHITIESDGYYGKGYEYLSANLSNKEYNQYIEIEHNPYLEKIKKAYDMGINRSYIFYCPPGSGKSTITVDLIKKLNLRTFTINSIGSFNMSKMKSIFEVFQFDAVIIDDMDHQNNIGAQALEALEYLKTQVKIVIATANILDGLNPALIRPGRIDEIIHVSNLSEEVVRKILGSHQDLFDQVKKLPVAYINEILYRIRLNGKENISNDIKEMTVRADNYLKTLKTTSDDDDMDDE